MKTSPIKLLKKDGIIASLDVGSAKISCFIARVTDDSGNFEIVGVGHQSAKGMKNGSVTDLNAAEQAIRQTVHAAESMAAKTMKGYPLRDVILAVPAIHTRSQAVDVDVQILGQAVTENDIRRALAKAQIQTDNHDRETIHTIPVGYTLDGAKGIQDPTNMTGHRLGVDIHMVDGNLAVLKNMATCIERSHLDIVSLCVDSYAAGLATLIEDERILGATVINIGAGTTSFAVFQEDKVLYAGGIGLGAGSITSDIAQGLGCSLADAERFKNLYGNAMATLSDEHEYIDVPTLGGAATGQDNHVSRAFLISIIQARLEEIFEMIRQSFTDAGLSDQLGQRVVLTGGGSLLPGICDLGGRILDKQVRLGQPVKIRGLPDATNGPAFAVCAGLLTYAATRAHEMPTEIAAHADQGSPWQRFQMWFKENW